ncbi:MAG TPA: DNA mismatch repair endonuclease MutL [Acidobacteriota bacterium]|nr:DNA mismatch repair endonuclease MutL [Acidobacteriota bacterium]
MIIHALDPKIVEKIAAGEVVERPVSVVKELLENSLDAGATQITISLENAGTSLVEVIDNGVGMSKEDLLACPLPHTTSKIKSLNDLFSIRTLGFRGEALASICAVSTVTIRTKPSIQIQGHELTIRGGASGTLTAIGCPTGTHVQVKNLFEFVPARLKFLKSQTTELSLIVDLVTHYCLSRPQTSITLLHNGKPVIQSPSTPDEKGKIAQIYGLDLAKQLVSFEGSADGVMVRGFTSNPAHTRSDKSGMSFFLNGRFVKNPQLIAAVVEGYGQLLMGGRYPVGVYHIVADPSAVDVNVHPSKDIVKFEAESAVLSLLSSSIESAFATTPLVRTYQPMQYQASLHEPIVTPDIAVSAQSVTTPTSPVSTASTKSTPDPTPAAPVVVKTSTQETFVKSTPQIPVNSQTTLRYLGLLHRTYALCEDAVGMVLIDFHAAHERYLYEIIKATRGDSASSTQALLVPMTITLSPTQMLAFKQNQNLLLSLGFYADEFGPTQVMLRSVPKIFHKQMSSQTFADIVDEIVAGKTSKIDDVADAVMIRMSCRAADKAGDELSDEKIKQIIRQVASANHKYSCPHGRPIFVRIAKSELEKMFKRRV